MKELIDEKFNKYFEKYDDPNTQILLIPIIKEILSMFIEHPTKPGYKRKDIIYFLNKLND